MIDNTRIPAANLSPGTQPAVSVTAPRESAPATQPAAPERIASAGEPFRVAPAPDKPDAMAEAPKAAVADGMPRHVTQGLVHEETGRYVVRVVAELDPGDIIVQYPPEELLRSYELAKELQAQAVQMKSVQPQSVQTTTQDLGGSLGSD